MTQSETEHITNDLNNAQRFENWLKNLKVGDTVVMRADDVVSTSYHVSEVVKVTPKGGIRIKGYKSILFRNGTAHWDSYHFYRLLEPTDELLDKIKLINIRRRIKSIDWSKIDDDVVKDVWELVRRYWKCV